MDFTLYTSEYGKSYGTKEEFMFRQAIYTERDAFINQWNSNPDNTHTLSHNKFSDWTESEMKKVRGFKAPFYENSSTVNFDVTDMPDSINWLEKGAVTPV